MDRAVINTCSAAIRVLFFQISHSRDVIQFILRVGLQANSLVSPTAQVKTKLLKVPLCPDVRNDSLSF